MSRTAQSRTYPAPSRPRGGQVVVLFACALVVILVIFAVTVDIGKMVLSKAQLQSATDASALAGASQLVGVIGSEEKANARGEARSLARANCVAGAPLTLTEEDVTFGCYVEENTNWVFRPEQNFQPGDVVDSIKIAGKRTPDSPDGPIEFFFTGIAGCNVTIQGAEAVATQPRRFVLFVMDRSGSMCFDTTGISHRYSPQWGAKMAKSPTGWYWMPKYVYNWGWRTAWMYARDDSTGQIVTDFLPDHIRSRLLYGTYFRYCSRDNPGDVQSGWLYAPPNVTIYSGYGPNYRYWYAEDYGPIGPCDYAMANNPIEPMASSQNAAIAFVDLLSSVGRDRAGLVTYAWSAELDQTLTDNWTTLRDEISTYDPRGATATPAGMEAANDEFIESSRAQGYGQRIMILLTDGMANTVNGVYYSNPWHRVTVEFFDEEVQCYVYQKVADALEAQAKRARDEGIRIYTVSFGEGADRDLMPLIAEHTDGAFYYAPDHESLTDIFVDIFCHLPPMLTQ